jgi:hypothetical protein
MTEIDFIQPKKTVGKLISVDVLDKILDEIWDIDDEIVLNPNSLECKRYVRVIKVIDIIDKYRAESEEL